MSNIFSGKFDTKQKREIGEIRSAFEKTCEEYSLIETGDRFAVGISGGKDSMTLLHLLAFKRLVLKMDFSFAAVYVHVENAAYNLHFDQVQRFCDDLETPLVVKNIVLEDLRNAENRCFICSRVRRKTLFDFTREEGFNKLALGHNMDDAVETLMMNMVYHGKFCSLPPKMAFFDGRLEVVRPLIKISKEQTRRYADLYGFPKVKSECGFETVTARGRFRQFADYLENMNPGARVNIFNSMSNINSDYLVK